MAIYFDNQKKKNWKSDWENNEKVYVPPWQCSSTFCEHYEESSLFKWEVWERPPYSTDLSPSDFHVLGPSEIPILLGRQSKDATSESYPLTGHAFLTRNF